MIYFKIKISHTFSFLRQSCLELLSLNFTFFYMLKIYTFFFHLDSRQVCPLSICCVWLVRAVNVLMKFSDGLYELICMRICEINMCMYRQIDKHIGNKKIIELIGLKFIINLQIWPAIYQDPLLRSLRRKTCRYAPEYFAQYLPGRDAEESHLCATCQTTMYNNIAQNSYILPGEERKNAYCIHNRMLFVLKIPHGLYVMLSSYICTLMNNKFIIIYLIVF